MTKTKTRTKKLCNKHRKSRKVQRIRKAFCNLATNKKEKQNCLDAFNKGFDKSCVETFLKNNKK
jgi:hypothetical protein